VKKTLDNAAHSTDESLSDKNDVPKFGRLLIVLVLAVLLVVVITFASEAAYS
jgi:hypothetical protein